MAEHLAEKSVELSYEEYSITQKADLNIASIKSANIIFLSFPSGDIKRIKKYLDFVNDIKKLVNKDSYIIIFADNKTLALLNYGIEDNELFNYKTWICLRQELLEKENALPNETKGAIVYSKSPKSINKGICKVRLPYTYCPACDRTTKDYGGKKHLYHEYGTTMRDVWRDFKIKANDDLPKDAIDRIRDMFSVEPHTKMVSLSLWNYDWSQCSDFNFPLPKVKNDKVDHFEQKVITKSELINGDALENLKKIESNSIDYIFIDPPYNLKKNYKGYHDNLEIEEYYSWCDEWLNECYRVLKPGKFLSILNMPMRCSRHFAFLNQKMELSSWITWDSLSRPARKIMPANYTILTMQKVANDANNSINRDLEENLLPKEDNYCKRKSCIKRREAKYKALSDLWTDIYRVKHNSRRYDHPTQLPSKLMKRLISIYTSPGEIVLDCFNGIGTTTLSAAIIGRKYVGIEIAEKYYNTAKRRHEDFKAGLDPFRKNNISAEKKTKNNNEKRLKSPNSRKDGLTKKKVQLKIKELSKKIGKIPTIDEALKHLEIPKEFYDDYFSSWSEVTAAAKTTGMTEYKDENIDNKDDETKQTNLFDIN